MQTGTQLSGKDIATAVFEVLGESVVAGDFESFQQMFVVPVTMALRDTVVPIETFDELQKFFLARHTAFTAAGVTQVRRVCIDATLIGHSEIHATHVGELIKDGKQVTEPQPIYSVLRKIDGKWKVTANQCGLSPDDIKDRATDKN